MPSKFKATRPLEYVCLFQMDFPTKDDGDVFVFFAVDAFSQLVFNTGIEKNRNNPNVIKHTGLLLKDKKFKEGLARNKSFTLVFHKFEDILPELNSLVETVGGKAIIDDAYVTQIMTPVMHSLFSRLSKAL